MQLLQFDLGFYLAFFDVQRKSGFPLVTYALLKCLLGFFTIRIISFFCRFPVFL